MKVFAYVRVSAREQDTLTQLQSIFEFCEKKNMQVLKVFEDKESGAIPFIERKMAREMLSEIEKVDAI
ncbi:MAG: recombinase family protein, partial [Archaeoglobaceae archaeon]|nr:recombinase family protein [Archaeoglobaceae archaeon]